MNFLEKQQIFSTFFVTRPQIFIFIFVQGPTKTCQVKELQTDLPKPCQFPFIWKGVKHYGCTTVDGGGIPWCSTKTVPQTLEHDISGEYYGNCDENVDACYRTDDKCDTDWTWTIWEKGEERKDGYFTLAVYQVKPKVTSLVKAMKSSPLLRPFCVSEFWGFSLLNI